MVDFDVLKSSGTTNERLKEFFSCELPHANTVAAWKRRPEGHPDRIKLERIEEDCKRRKEYEDRIGSWLNESIVFSLQNHYIYSAVDMAWDSAPINKLHIPLLMYAQGRIKIEEAAKSLKDLPDGENYVKRNDHGQVVTIDLPKFFDVRVNLIRSVITRRLAPQVNKYNNLYPFFKYEGRSKSQVAKLRSEAVSERMDIMADQYDYRSDEEQEDREMLMYGHSVSFTASAWDRELQWERADVAEELAVAGEVPKRERVVREGVKWVSAHPSRVIWDNNYPLRSLNTDTGCEWCGFWDVTRYRDIAFNPVYFNRNKVTWGPNATLWYTAFATYFSEHFDKIKPPSFPNDIVGLNDRKSNIGLYTSEQADSATFMTHLYVKETPKTWNWGTYPHPIWVHLVVAGDHTVIGAEIMPSSPAAVGSFNESDSRLVNISLAHELMPYQDQLTNLYTQFLETLRNDLFSVAVLNTDIFPDNEEGQKALKQFRASMEKNNYRETMQILVASFARAQQILGTAAALTAENIFKIVRTPPNEKLGDLLRAISQTFAMAERMVWLSPAEQGQTATHEVTARETHEISGTTDDMRNFFSDAIDKKRAAKKRICYESWLAKGSDKVELSIANRYPRSVIQKAGLEVVDEDGDGDLETASGLPTKNRYVRLVGSKKNLAHDYIFTTRDGSERSADTKAATVLVELLGRMAQFAPEIQKAVMGGMGREKLYEIINEVFRMADASIDLKLELKPGEDDALLIEDDEQVMGMIQQLAQQLNVNVQEVQMLKQMIARVVGPMPMGAEMMGTGAGAKVAA